MTEASSNLRHLSPSIVGPVSCYPLQALARALTNSGIVSIENPQGSTAVFVTKTLSKLRLVRNVARSSAGPVFVAFMGYAESRTIPFSYWAEIIPYCFDCWPATYDRWRSMFVRHRVRLAFFSARQSAEYFAKELKKMRSVWLPEATDPNDYVSACPLTLRNIDVLELGRKNDSFHNTVREHLSRTARRHLFERVKGEIVFSSRRELIAGLALSKISVCFPCSQTHPERSGPVETVTHRYFESMASKCIILGHCPAELKDLFGYNPVVEVEQGHEIEQLEFILTNLRGFEPVVERNYSRLLEIGTWASRVPTILQHAFDLTSATRFSEREGEAASAA